MPNNLGDASCLGLNACFDNTGKVADLSCDGDYSCYENSCDVGFQIITGPGVGGGGVPNPGQGGGVGNGAPGPGVGNMVQGAAGGSCLGYKACFENSNDIGQGSCISVGQDKYACFGNNATVMDGSCLGYLSVSILVLMTLTL